MADQDIEARAREVCSHCGGEGTVVTRHLWTAPCPVCERIAQLVQEERDRLRDDVMEAIRGLPRDSAVVARVKSAFRTRTQGGTKP